MLCLYHATYYFYKDYHDIKISQFKIENWDIFLDHYIFFVPNQEEAILRLSATT